MNGNGGLEQNWVAFSQLHHRLLRLVNRRLVEQGASLASTRVLFYLDRHGPKRATDIAEFFTQAPRTVTEAIDRLEKLGFVRRDGGVEDRRVKYVSLTDAGRSAVKATEPLKLQLITQIFGVLDAQESDLFAGLLEKLDGAITTQETV